MSVLILIDEPFLPSHSLAAHFLPPIFFTFSCLRLSNFSIHFNQFLKLYVLHERIRHRGARKRGGGGPTGLAFSMPPPLPPLPPFSLYPLVSLSSSFFNGSSKGKWIKGTGWPLYSLEVIDQHFQPFGVKKKPASFNGNASSTSLLTVKNIYIFLPCELRISLKFALC